MASLSAQSSHLEDQLRTAENDLAEQQAKVRQIERGGLPVDLNETEKTKDNTPRAVAPQVHRPRTLATIRRLVTNLAHLRQTSTGNDGQVYPRKCPG